MRLEQYCTSSPIVSNKRIWYIEFRSDTATTATFAFKKIVQAGVCSPKNIGRVNDRNMNKVIITAFLPGRKIYVVIGAILLILYTDIDTFILHDFGAIDTASNCNHYHNDDTSSANRIEMINYELPERTYDEEESSRRSSSRSKLRNLRLVFLGDSVTRYQYLSLAYYIRYGYWYDTSIVAVNNLMNAHSFHHPFHPHEDWNEFFLQSNRILHPMEICDCIRGGGNGGSSNNNATNILLLVERRYFYDHRNNNMLVYINMNGNETSPGGRGYYGRLLPETIFTPNFHNMVGIVSGMEYFHHHHHQSSNSNSDENEQLNIAWEYYTWDEVIRYHIGLLDFNYNHTTVPPLLRGHQRQSEHSLTSSTLPLVLDQPQPPKAYVLLNAGLHPHDFHNPVTIQNVVHALRDTQLYGTWKTTTYTKVHVLQEQQRTGIITTMLHPDETTVTELDIQHNQKHNVTATAISDANMCQALLPHACFNVSWILQLRSPISQYYVDNLHFMEPIYRIMNEEYLQQLSLLSFQTDHDYGATTTTYIPLNRAQIVLQP